MHLQIHDNIVIWLGKIILSLIMFSMGIFCLIVFRYSGQWRSQLKALESECDIARDSVMIQATIARSQLADIAEKLTTKPEKSEFEVVGNLIKQAMPVVNLLLHKETSLIKWGFAGVKLIRSAAAYFSRDEKN